MMWMSGQKVQSCLGMPTPISWVKLLDLVVFCSGLFNVNTSSGSHMVSKQDVRIVVRKIFWLRGIGDEFRGFWFKMASKLDRNCCNRRIMVHSKLFTMKHFEEDYIKWSFGIGYLALFTEAHNDGSLNGARNHRTCSVTDWGIV